MTISGIIFCVIVSIAVLLLTAWATDYFDWLGIKRIVAISIAIVIVGATWGGSLWYFQNTAKGQRALKTQNSELGSGIKREVIVYDIEGDVIEQYVGKFDIDYTDERIMFDDENGNRHVIYFKTGTVIVNELAD